MNNNGTWIGRNIDPAMAKKMHIGEKPDWKKGDGDVTVKTLSGATYKVTSQGNVSGGSRDIEDGFLAGSVYRGGGPIRGGQIVVGMSMEIQWNGKRLVTSSVEEVK